MPNIFVIQADRDNFQVLDLELSDLLRLLPKGISLDSVVQFSYQNPPMTSWWKTPTTCFVGDKGSKSAIPDLSLWADATLILSPKAYDQLVDSLKSSGEFLPIKIGRKKFYIFICFVVCEAETFSTDEEDQMIPGPGGLTFKKNAEDLMLFKSVAGGSATLCCSERFKRLVESSELNGIMFY